MAFLDHMYSGRIGRLNFILGTIFFMILLSVGLFLSMIIGAVFNITGTAFLVVLSALSLIYFIIFVYPLWARRLHDLGKSGWIMLPYFLAISLSKIDNEWIKLACFLVALCYLPTIVQILFFGGQSGANNFGEEPSRTTGFFKQIFNVSDPIIDNQSLIK
ncbi:MAG: DUF805 domain-containing protein [Candidatus Pacebacteria bacterium]|nr:DUF805 domain-containing protein [Candidatus Paceibacterota bacterium]